MQNNDILLIVVMVNKSYFVFHISLLILLTVKKEFLTRRFYWNLSFFASAIKKQ